MTNEEAISTIEIAKAECEWNAPLDYQIAFDMAIEALQSPQAKQESAMLLAGHLAETILKTAADIVKEELSDTRLYVKIDCASEPNEIAEKIYQLCGDREKLIEVWKWIGEYIESESEETTNE